MHSEVILSAVNPRTGKVDYSYPRPSDAGLKEICGGLRANQPAWSAAGLEHRIAVLNEWADAIERFAGKIGDAEYADTGRYRLSHEIPSIVAFAVRDWCRKAPAIVEGALRQGTSTVDPKVSYSAQLVPFPLIGMITPWNHPFMLATIDAIPALLAGSSVIVKPSEIAPRFVEPVMESVRAVPELAGVFRLVAGDAQTGKGIIEEADMICFTGSIAIGRTVAEACARRLIPLNLEMGGKDPAIVTEGADLDRAAAAILRGSVAATGQICFSIERVYVQESVHDAFVELLKRKSEELELSYPAPRAGHVGPFILQRQAAIVDRHIDDALAKGARLVTGGKSENLGGGLYMRPTVLTEVNHDMLIMKEETFGPVTPVMRYRTVDEAVALANDSTYGLSAAVFASSPEEAIAIASRVEAGAITVQDAAATISIQRDAEKMSFKQSGLGGSRMGPNAMIRFFRKKTFVQRTEPLPDMRALDERLAKSG